MSSTKFYNDDVVALIDEVTKTVSVGLVTKEKPTGPNIKNKDSNHDKIENNTELDNEEIEKDVIDNSESDDDSSDGNLYTPPQTGMVNVNWTIHKYFNELEDWYDDTYIESVAGNGLTLLDRALSISDIVKINIGNETKVGTIFNMRITADVVVISQNKILKNVDCSRMKWIEPYMRKDLETNYIYKSWLGEMLQVYVDVLIRFSDGARMKVPETVLEGFQCETFVPYTSDIILENTIMKGDALDLKSRKSRFISETERYNAKWLSKLKREEMVYILIEKVVPTSADMQWVFGYSSKEGPVVLEAPPQILKGKELEKLEQIHPYHWQCVSVGDIWYYKMEDNETAVEFNPDENFDQALYKLMKDELPKVESVNKNCNLTDHNVVPKQISDSVGSGFVVKPRKKILCSSKNRKLKKYSQSHGAAMYTDDSGSEDQEPKEDDIKSKEALKEHLEILKKETFHRIKSDEYVPVGIILTKCTVDVSWQDGTITYNIPTEKLIPETFNIDEHDFFPGDFVVQKFDPLNQSVLTNSDSIMHNFGSVIKSNSRDRVATIQWFDYDDSLHKLLKAGEPCEVGVYDIAALNEHHFLLGEEVIVKQEASYKNYPAGYVTRLDLDEGQFIIRWPDSTEMPLSPTDLLLTVQSALDSGGGAAAGGGLYSDVILEFGLSDDDDSLEDEIDSVYGDSDSEPWETEEEIDYDFVNDEQYLNKLRNAKVELKRIKKKIQKIISVLSSVTDFSMIVQANLPGYISQMINITQMFHDVSETEKTANGSGGGAVDKNELSLEDQQLAMKTLFEIRKNLASVYRDCSDVQIKAMFQRYKPRNFLSFRKINNFIVTNGYFKPNNTSTLNKDDNEAGDEGVGQCNGTLNVVPNSDEEDVHKILADYLRKMYNEIISNLNTLQESINAWLGERSYYLGKGTAGNESDSQNSDKSNNEENVIQQQQQQVRTSLERCDGVDKDDNNELGVFDLPPDLINKIQSPEPSNMEPELVPKEGVVINERHFTESDRTMSNCESIPEEQRGQFVISDTAPSSHKFINASKPSVSNSKFFKAWKRDLKLLSTSLPKGVTVKTFDDRIDLFCVMIIGPSGTPYQHALFFFDIQLGSQYPATPPAVFFHSLAPERVNPNLYTEGRVCLSLLGTWNGKGTENWDSKVSSLLQLIVSLQGLILVSEPYYNEAGFEIQKGTEEGKVNSQKYNENAINNINQSMINLLHKPFSVFESEIKKHFKEFGKSLIDIHEHWAGLDESKIAEGSNSIPDFPLAPVSKGFQLSMRRHNASLNKILEQRLEEWQ